MYNVNLEEADEEFQIEIFIEHYADIANINLEEAHDEFQIEIFTEYYVDPCYQWHDEK